MANALLLFLQAHEYQFDCMMKLERVFSGQCLNPPRIQDWFGSEKRFPEIAQLVCLGERGVPVRVTSRGDLAFALRYSNHSSADGFVDEISDKIRVDVRFGRAFVSPRDAAPCLPGLRVSPLAVIKSSTKLRVVHDLTFSSSPSTISVNEDTEFSSAPKCELGHVLRDIMWRIRNLRQRFGGGARIALRKMDVKDAFRQVPVEITREPVFGYVFIGLMVVDRRLHFGWRNSPGFWSLFALAFEHAHNNTSYRGAVCTDSGREATRHVVVRPPCESRTAALPPGYVAPPGRGGGADDSFFARFYVDDGVSVEVQWYPSSDRCLCASASLASDHFRLFWRSRSNRPPTLVETQNY